MELVARLPRIRRLRPRRPKDYEIVGIALVVLFAPEVVMATKVVATGRYLDKGFFQSGTRLGGPFETGVCALVGLVCAAMVILGIVLAWDWLKNPWESDE